MVATVSASQAADLIATAERLGFATLHRLDGGAAGWATAGLPLAVGA